MGKGGYLGGSTILHIKQTKNDNYAEENIYSNKKYPCKICGLSFEENTYFDHLEKKHNLHGCYKCGEPYRLENEKVHLCKKCGNRILIQLSRTTKIKEKYSFRSISKKVIQEKNIKQKKEVNFKISLGEILQKAINKKIKPK